MLGAKTVDFRPSLTEILESCPSKFETLFLFRIFFLERSVKEVRINAHGKNLVPESWNSLFLMILSKYELYFSQRQWSWTVENVIYWVICSHIYLYDRKNHRRYSYFILSRHYRWASVTINRERYLSPESSAQSSIIHKRSRTISDQTFSKTVTFLSIKDLPMILSDSSFYLSLSSLGYFNLPLK